jgi:hypothetical protein
MDAVRTMHLLRILGLITKPTKNMYQLALGAGSGEKDIYSLHKVPEIVRKNDGTFDYYEFAIHQEKVAHVVVSDSDPQRSELYQNYNQNLSQHVLAYNDETDIVLNKIRTLNLQKRNLISAIRLDHRMIPDAQEFLASLITCLDDQCDLIFTIGSGDKPEDFDGRVSVLAELFSILGSLRLRPVLLKLHSQGNVLQQYQSLRYGNPLTSTYQILYCKLKKKDLANLSKS